MKRKSLFVLFGFLFGLCGMFCMNLPAQASTQASSATAFVWDGQTPQSEDELNPGEWYLDDENSTWHINSARALAYFGHLVNSGENNFSAFSVCLETDIDLAGFDWEPIGWDVDSGRDFEGVFDGQGHSIFNVKIDNRNNTQLRRVGFFGSVKGASGDANGATIKNLSLKNIQYDLAGNDNTVLVGGVAGEVGTGSNISNCSVENCYVDGRISVQDFASANVGGLFGKISNLSILNCGANVDISISNMKSGGTFDVGGLVGSETGSLETRLEYSFFAGSAKTPEQEGAVGSIGGLVGDSSANLSISNCYNVGTLDGGSANVGGLVGEMSNNLSISNSYNAGKITYYSSGFLYAGGLVGRTSSFESFQIKNSFSIGQMEGDFRKEISPLYNASESGEVAVERAYFDGSLLGGDRKNAVDGLIYLARTRDFYRSSYFDGSWNFPEDASIKGWTIGSENNRLPFFNFDVGSNNDQKTTAEDFRGEGTMISPYLIESAGDLALLSQKTADGVFTQMKEDGKVPYFSLQNDINLVGQDWVPIGYGVDAFTGVFDGNNHTISGLYSTNQNNLKYQGLFGRTSEALIKNLKISNFNFLSRKPSAGNLIGSVAGLTYIVNCADENDASFDTVGKIENGTLYVVYGKNNLEDKKLGGTLDTLHLTVAFTTRYDISFSGEGGFFYRQSAMLGEMNSSLYPGEFHLIVDESGKIFTQSIDNTFGKTVPGLSINFGKTDVLLRRGYKLQGYKTASSSALIYSTSTSSWERDFSTFKKDAVKGLLAVWDGNASQTVRVVYNAYELSKLHAVQNSAATYIGKSVTDNSGNAISSLNNQFFKINLDSSTGNVYVDYLLEYDSILAENAFIFAEPYYLDGEDSPQMLRGNDFEMAGIYKSINEDSANFFADEFVRENANMFVNENLPSTLYAAWKGVEIKNSTIQFVFKNIADETVDVIKEISMLGYESTSDLEPEKTVGSGDIDEEKNYVVNFDFNTLFSDKVEKYIQFELSLNDGYCISARGISVDDGNLDLTDVDRNFGSPWTNMDNLGDLTTLEQLNALKFFNLQKNHKIEVELERVPYTDKVEISSDRIFVGVGTADKLKVTKNSNDFSSNVTISPSISASLDVDLVKFLKRYKKDAVTDEKLNSILEGLAEAGEIYFAFDLVHSQIIFSTANYDSIELNLDNFTSKAENKINIYATFTNEDASQTVYLFTKQERQDEDTYQDVQIQNVSKKNEEQILFAYNSTDTEQSYISYRAFNSFVMIFSTEYANSQDVETSSFKSVGPIYYDLYDAENRMEASKLKAYEDKEEGNPTKYLFAFKNTFHQTRLEGEQEPRIEVITEYVDATIEFEFAYLDPDSKELTDFEKTQPTLLWQSTKKADIEEMNGSMDIYFEQSNFYKFFNDTSAVLYSDGSLPLHPDTSETYNLKIEVQAATLDEAQDNESFVDGLNRVNPSYFEIETQDPNAFKKIQKGQAVNFETNQIKDLAEEGDYVFQNDGYYLRLKFNLNNGAKLRVGKYVATLVFTDQLYEVHTSTQVLLQEDVAKGEDSLDALTDRLLSEEFTEKNSNITTIIMGEEENSAQLKYDEELALSSQTTDNHGYVFYRWMLRSEGQNQFFVTSNLKGEVSRLYQQSEEPNDEEKFKIQAFAIYLRKDATFELLDRAYLENKLLTTDEVSRREIGFSMDSMTYSYGTERDVENLTISLFGTSEEGEDASNGYYLSGYSVLTASGEELAKDIFTPYQPEGDETNSTTKITIDMAWVQNAIANDQIVRGTNLAETFYIVPIIERKTVSIHFHSGTGEEQEYGDKKAGHVFDSANLETTTEEYVFDKDVKFGDFFALDVLVPNGQTLTVEALFNSRTGHSLADNNYWKWQTKNDEGALAAEDVLAGSVLSITQQMFDENKTTAEIHLFRLWKANSSEIVFHANGGNFQNPLLTEKTVEVIYEQTTTEEFVGKVKADILPVSRNGYSLTGWALDPSGANVVFQQDGTPLNDTYFKNGKFIFGADLDVYAVWGKETYEIEIFFNKAETVPGQEEKATSHKFSLEYDSSFGNLQLGDGLKGIEAYTTENVKREGFIFDGVYAIDAYGERIRIDNSYVFNADFPGFSANAAVAVTLYFAWTFDTSNFALAAQSTHSSIMFNGEEQNVELLDYFAGVQDQTKGFVVNEEGEDLISLSSEVTTITLSTSLESSTAVVHGKKAFGVTNVGSYSVRLTVLLVDPMTENEVLDSNFNLGTLQTIVLDFSISVTKATLGIDKNLDNGLLLENLKRLVGPYLPSVSTEGPSLRDQLLSANSLNSATAALKVFDTSIAEKSDEEIYEYMMTRFYLLSNVNETNLGNQQASTTYYKNWTYESFEEYKSQNSDQVENILSTTYFFGFFDVAHSSREYDLVGEEYAGRRADYTDFVSLTANGVQPNGLQLTKLKIYSSHSFLQAGGQYSVRAYVSGAPTTLQNYVLEEENGEYYFETSLVGYIFPQFLTVENTTPEKQVYFSSLYSTSREVPWQMSTDKQSIENQDFFLLHTGAQDVYLFVQLNTSNIGNYAQDKTFNFFDPENFIYFSNVRALVKNEDSYLDITYNFKFLLDENFSFVIKSTTGVANVTVSAQYLTKEGGNIVFGNLPEEQYSSVLAISQIKYDLGQGEKSILGRDINHLGAYEQDGSLLFEVISNHANQVEVFVGNAVTELIVSVTSLKLGDFLGLLAWSGEGVYEVTGKMEQSTSHRIARKEIDENSQYATTDVARMTYYAVFTDLVKVTYDLNFPDEYEGTKEYDSTLKLGTVLGEDILPYQSGLGQAANLFVREEDGTETNSYTSLNNTSFGGRMVFGGWDNTTDTAGNIFRFKPITLSARWNLPKEMQYEKLLEDDARYAVYSFGPTMSVSQMVRLLEMNDNMFDYSYSWEVDFDDETPTQTFENAYTIDLRGQGGISASGTYTLKITRNLNQVFIDANTFESTEPVTFEISSHITFMPYILTEIQKPGNPSVVYDGKEHRGDIVVRVKYKAFNNNLDDYDAETLEEIKYAETGLFTFTIEKEKELVKSIVDVGEYDITMHLSEDMFTLGEGLSAEDVKFVFSVTPMIVELKNETTTFEFSKKFNEVDPEMTQMTEIATGIVVTLKFSRDGDEDVGTKNLLLADVLSTNNKNFTLQFGGSTIFENGLAVGNTPVGTFTITASGTLQIDLQGEKMIEKRVKKTYSSTPTTLSINEFVLSLDGGDETISLNMLLRDVSKGEDLSEKDVLQFLKDKMSSLKAGFANFQTSKISNSATDAGIYTFNFDVTGTKLAAYYSSVSISTNYIFEITKKEISLKGQNFDKDYDGQFVNTFDLDGFDDLRANVVYASTHASEKVTISSVRLEAKSASTNVQNFTVVDFPAYAQIRKLTATLTLGLTGDEDGTFEYGTLSANNLSNFVVPSKLEANGKTLDLSLLVSGYYKISLELLAGVETNPRGFLFAGTYDVAEEGQNVKVSGDFDDFDMTFEEFSFEVVAKTIPIQIIDNFKTITTFTKVAESYDDTLFVTETGDELTLKYVIADKTKIGQTLEEGTYALELLKDWEYAKDIQGSIVVELSNPDNKGLNVVQQTGKIVLTILNAEDLSLVYNGQVVTISSTTKNSFVISNQDESKTINFTVAEEIEQEFTYSLEFDRLAKNAGQYRLVLTGEAEGFEVMFAEDYRFTITRKEIKAKDLERKFDKAYDGTRSAGPVDDFEGKIAGDDVSISGTFDDANASTDPKTVTLYEFFGKEASNYVLDTKETTSYITKASAKIVFFGTDETSKEFEYGTLTKDNLLANLSLSVEVGETSLLQSLFNLAYASAQITDEAFSGRGFLNVKEGGYDITISADNTSSQNYEIASLTAHITVVPHNISLTINQIIKSVEMGSQDWEEIDDAFVEYTIPSTMNDLIESVNVRLKVDGLSASSKGVGRYKISSKEEDFISLNPNYKLIAVVDGTEEGSFEITKQVSMVYVLVDSETATTNQARIALFTEYDGKEYDSIILKQVGDAWWLYLQNSSTKVEKALAKLGFFKLVDNEYVKYAGDVKDLTAEFRLSKVKFVTDQPISVVVSNASSSTHEVKFGLDVPISNTYDFTLTVLQKKLTSKTEKIQQAFNNQDAIYAYENASDLLEGIVDGETLSLSIRFVDKDGKTAKYSSLVDEYDVEATLSGETANQYDVSSLQDGSGNVVKGVIDRAEINLQITSKTVTYGDVVFGENPLVANVDYVFNFGAIENFNLQEYLDNGRTFNFTITLSTLEENKSTTNFLNVGQYFSIIARDTAETCDFRLVGVTIDGQDGENHPVLTVSPRTIKLSSKDVPLQEIFTRNYSKSLGRTAKIFSVDGTNENDNLLFNISNILSIMQDERKVFDDVKFLRAEFSADRGVGLQVTFFLDDSCKDSKNYVVEPYMSGVINPVKVLLEFDFDHDNIQTDVVGETIQALAYPFLENSAYLTANSYDPNTASTKNFPSTLSGKRGYNFAFWTLTLTLSEDADIKAQQLEKIRSWQERFGITLVQLDENGELVAIESLDESASSVNIVVGNDEITVNLLRDVLSDETDLFGLYYDKLETVKIVFKDNWQAQKYDLQVQVLDENENSTTKPLGQVSSDSFDENVSDSKIFDDIFTFENKDTISMTAVSHKHAKFVAFFFGGRKLEEGSTQIDGVGTFVVSGDSLEISGICSNISIIAMFKPQKVKFTLQLDEEIKGEVQIENNVFDVNFVWETDFFEIETKTFADLPILTLIGRSLVGYMVDSEKVLAELFAETNLVKDEVVEDVEIVLQPIFEPKTISVELQFGYGNKTETIFVKYGEQFLNAVDGEGQKAWKEKLERTGYDFLGWFDGENKVVGSDTLLEESKTLVAQWQKQRFDVLISLENVQFVSSDLLAQSDGNIVGQDIEFETALSFQVRAKVGYTLPDTSLWNEKFSVTIDSQGVATVTFTLDAEDFEATISATPRNNAVTFSGTDIESAEVFDITDEKSKIDTSEVENVFSFNILSGKALQFEVGAIIGYEMSETVIFQSGGRTLTANDLENMEMICQTEIDENGKLILKISGVTADVSITFQASRRRNTLSIEFNEEEISIITINGQQNREPSSGIKATVLTGDDFVFVIEFAHGFDYGSFVLTDAFESTKLSLKSHTSTGSGYRVTLKDVYSDGTVVIQSSRRKYTLTMNATSYDEANHKVSENENYVLVATGEQSASSVIVEYGTKVTLQLHNRESYKFVGWSTDGVNAMEENRWAEFGFVHENFTWTYTVLDDATFWAIFSQDSYHITLGMYDFSYYVDDEQSNIADKYVLLEGKTYFDANGEEILNGEFEIFYGEEKTISFDVPEGYMYYGYGFLEDNGNFKIIDSGLRNDQKMTVTIQTTKFGPTFVEKLYVVVVSYESKIHVSSKIDFKGVLGDDLDVGGVELCDRNGNPVNEFGYVDGTRVHYADIAKKNTKDFDFVAYTQTNASTRDEIYLKVSAARAGYYFERIEVNNNAITIEQRTSTEDFVIYKLSGLVGGMEGLEILVIYAPNLNAIEVSFTHNDVIAPGGLFDIQPESEEIVKLWTSGNGYSNVTISAFTDVKFKVTAYIRAGFFIDPSSFEDCIFDPQNIIVAGSLRFEELSIRETGFTGKISFDVFGFADISEIKIAIQDTKYTVVFKDVDEQNKLITLATVRDVGFNTSLQNYLLKSNEANITSNLGFVDGHLNLVRTRAEHNFEGYFTDQNGAGRQYVGTNGTAEGVWLESGYIFNPATGYYELQENAKMNDDGQIEIWLYAYLSYFKTRLNIVYSPDINTNFTAQDVVSGVDATNSWFYFTNPNYIEISFNTDIYITAPEINGYKFYQFIVSQRAFGQDEWLSPVVFFQDRIPWSTNEVDRIVECRIEIVYFAQLDVQVLGGEGTFEIKQSFDNAQAENLLKEHYFDTTKTVTITAKPDYGFVFKSWQYQTQTFSGENNISINLDLKRRATLYLNLQGLEVTLDFKAYDVQLGQIVGLTITSLSGSQRFVNNMVTSLAGGTYRKNVLTVPVVVGETVTFAVEMPDNIAADWKPEEVQYQEYRNGTTYFTLKIVGDYAFENDGNLVINPQFTTAKRTIYISRAFAKDEIFGRALDSNNVNNALVSLVDGNMMDTFSVTRGADVKIDLLINARYAVKNLTIQSGSTIKGMQFLIDNKIFVDNKIVLTEKDMQDFNLGGNIFVQIEATRLMWEDFQQESDAFSGAGTQKSPYRLESVDDLVLMMKLVNSGAKNSNGEQYRNCAFILEADINLDERFWTPIGTSENTFNGSFNFNGHEVKRISLAIAYDQISYNGLFGVLGENARITRGNTPWWWWLLILILVVFLLLLRLYLVYRNKKKNKDSEEMAKR